MRVLNFILSVTFLVLASLQVNSVEPVRWILIFGTMSIVCIFAMFHYFLRSFLFSLVALVAMYGVYLWFVPTNNNPWALNGIAGLLLCMVVLIVQVVRSYRVK
ncbi:hypothetical protein QQ054_33065 [Oscillatoria amoena NRMC-F 0135]|nr:hypothetical protein [Oscillatoria amoena NRMC-F 0135]